MRTRQTHPGAWGKPAASQRPPVPPPIHPYYPHGIAQCPPVDLNPFNLHQNLADPEPFALDSLWPWIDVFNTDTMAIAMGWQKPDNVAGSSAPAIMVGLFVASGGLLFGYDTG